MCPSKLEVGDVLGERQLGDRELVLDRACLLLGDLGLEQVAHDPLRLVLALQRRRHDLVEGAAHAEELQLAHEVEDPCPVHHLAFHQPALLRRVVTGAVGGRLVPQPQRVRGDDRDRRPRIAATGEDVQDDVGRVDAVAQRLGAGGLDRRAARR